MPSMSIGQQDEPIVGPGLRGPGRDPALGRGASCSLTMTGHVPLHRAWARRPRIPGNAPAAAAAAARAAAVTARLIIEVNLKGITDPVLAEEFGAAAAAAGPVAERADAIVAAVRAEVAR